MELRGNLRDFSLPDIIQLVGFGRKTGVLQVDGDGGCAALYFEEGKVVHAAFGETRGESAVYRLFRVAAGEFRFHSETLPPDRTIAMDPTNLVMEAARLLDEARRDEDAEPVLDLATEGDWFNPLPEPRAPEDIKRDIRELLSRRFGRGAKRLLQAVDRCGDSPEEMMDLAERVEKYVRVFLDGSASQETGRQIRSLIGGPPSS